MTMLSEYEQMTDHPGRGVRGLAVVPAISTTDEDVEPVALYVRESASETAVLQL